MENTAEQNQSLEDIFHNKFSNGLLANESSYGMECYKVDASICHDILQYLKIEHKFQFLTDLTGIQSPDEKMLGVIYHLHNLVENKRIRIKTYVSIEKPDLPSATDLWKGANWMERETFDFFGINFVGHPNLTRILNVDEMTIFPLRKEYPLEDQTRKDKSDKMFGR